MTYYYLRKAYTVGRKIIRTLEIIRVKKRIPNAVLWNVFSSSYDWLFDWLVGFNFGRQLSSGLLPTVWDTHNFDPPQRGCYSAWGSHTLCVCPSHHLSPATPTDMIWIGTWRTLHPRWIFHAQAPLAYMALFRRASLEPRPSGPELSA